MSSNPVSKSHREEEYMVTADTVSIAAARVAKYEVGAREHGPIMTDDPLLAAFEEALDGQNYCDELLKRGADQVGIRSLQSLFHLAGNQALRIWRGGYREQWEAAQAARIPEKGGSGKKTGSAVAGRGNGNSGAARKASTSPR